MESVHQQSPASWMRCQLAHSTAPPLATIHLVISLQIPADMVGSSVRVSGGLQACGKALRRLPHLDGANIVSREEEVSLNVKADTVDMRAMTSQLLGHIRHHQFILLYNTCMTAYLQPPSLLQILMTLSKPAVATMDDLFGWNWPVYT